MAETHYQPFRVNSIGIVFSEQFDFSKALYRLQSILEALGQKDFKCSLLLFTVVKQLNLQHSPLR